MTCATAHLIQPSTIRRWSGLEDYNILAQHLKQHLLSQINFLFQRNNLNDLITDSLKPMHPIFVEVQLDLMYQMLFVGQLGLYHCE